MVLGWCPVTDELKILVKLPLLVLESVLSVSVVDEEDNSLDMVIRTIPIFLENLYHKSHPPVARTITPEKGGPQPQVASRDPPWTKELTYVWTRRQPLPGMYILSPFTLYRCIWRTGWKRSWRFWMSTRRRLRRARRTSGWGSRNERAVWLHCYGASRMLPWRKIEGRS